MYEQTASPENTTNPAKVKARIVVADDEPRILRWMQKALEAEGYSVETAQDGKVALEKMRGNPPDILVTDLMMPVMDGIELSSHCLKDSELCDVPIILLSARASPGSSEDNERWLAMLKHRPNIQFCITKPFNPKEVVEAVERLLLG